MEDPRGPIKVDVAAFKKYGATILEFLNAYFAKTQEMKINFVIGHFCGPQVLWLQANGSLNSVSAC